MSLGFLTESALIPRKANPIKVDDKASLFNLQASIAEKEREMIASSKFQKRLLSSDETKKIKNGERKEKRDRDKDESHERKARKRQRKEEAALIKDKLASKAAKYDDIVAGRIKTDAKESLVDVHAKHELIMKHDLTTYDESERSNTIEIVDEFGRNVHVPRGSEQHMKHIGTARRLASDKRRMEVDGDGDAQKVTKLFKLGSMPEAGQTASASYRRSALAAHGDGKEISRPAGAVSGMYQAKSSDVKSQWEMGLSSSEMDTLMQITEETERVRGKAARAIASVDSSLPGLRMDPSMPRPDPGETARSEATTKDGSGPGDESVSDSLPSLPTAPAPAPAPVNVGLRGAKASSLLQSLLSNKRPSSTVETPAAVKTEADGHTTVATGLSAIQSREGASLLSVLLPRHVDGSNSGTDKKAGEDAVSSSMSTRERDIEEEVRSLKTDQSSFRAVPPPSELMPRSRHNGMSGTREESAHRRVDTSHHNPTPAEMAYYSSVMQASGHAPPPAWPGASVMPQWIRYFDQGSGRYYIHNPYTGETKWE